MKKYVEIRKKGETQRKKGSPNMKVKMPIKWKNEPPLNFDEQQDAIKHLKEYHDIDEIEPLWKDMAVCVTFNQPFA